MLRAACQFKFSSSYMFWYILDLLLCNGCNMIFHLECHVPKLLIVPWGKWYFYCCTELFSSEIVTERSSYVIIPYPQRKAGLVTTIPQTGDNFLSLNTLHWRTKLQTPDTIWVLADMEMNESYDNGTDKDKNKDKDKGVISTVVCDFMYRSQLTSFVLHKWAINSSKHMVFRLTYIT